MSAFVSLNDVSHAYGGKVDGLAGGRGRRIDLVARAAGLQQTGKAVEEVEHQRQQRPLLARRGVLVVVEHRALL